MNQSNNPEVRNFLQEHIRDGIHTNVLLRRRYRELSDGRSEKIFRFLINAERMALPLAYLHDRRTHFYQRSGLKLFEQEFRPMNKPQVQRIEIPDRKRIQIDWKKSWAVLNGFLRKNEPDSFQQECLKKIRELEESPDFSIMVRHLFESVFRGAFFLEQHEEEAIRLGIASPRKIIFDLIRFQLWGLPGMNLIDNWAEPLQSEGVPIFRFELPDLLQDLELSIPDS